MQYFLYLLLISALSCLLLRLDEIIKDIDEHFHRTHLPAGLTKPYALRGALLPRSVKHECIDTIGALLKRISGIQSESYNELKVICESGIWAEEDATCSSPQMTKIHKCLKQSSLSRKVVMTKKHLEDEFDAVFVDSFDALDSDYKN